MLKDDRMMSMLTFAVIMVAVGTLIQRVDVVAWLFGGGPAALEFQRDEVIVRANALSGIDVLANDLGIREGDAENLFIVEQPECGRVFVRDGQAQYLPAKQCVGSQTFRYALTGRSYQRPGEVLVVVRLAEPTQSAVTADSRSDLAAPAPMVPRIAEQGVGGTPALLAAQPPAGADPGGAIVPTPVPTVPRPQAPLIAGLPDPAPAAGSAVAGVTFDGSALTPRMAAPAGGLGDAPEIAAVPVVPRPAPEAPALPEPASPESGSPESVRPAPASPALTAPEAPSSDSRAPRLVLPPPDPLPAGSAAGGGSAPGSDPGATDEPAATVAFARIDPVPLATGAAVGPSIQRENDGLGANVPRAGLPELGSGGSGQSGFGQPGDVLPAVPAPGDPIELAP
ncbi:MAG: hypothetical protein IIC03_14995, partial [Proteobacteria bacterium]|nr:hypothetical protein [Pseudomonadota bacterium]